MSTWANSAERQYLVAQLSAELIRILNDPAFLTRAFKAFDKLGPVNDIACRLERTV